MVVGVSFVVTNSFVSPRRDHIFVVGKFLNNLNE
jgi:hypothetical protein